MASLIPLLHDLLPMIIPSKVHVARDKELVAVAERAEMLPWYKHTPQSNVPQQQTDDADIDDARSLAGSQRGQQAGPIELLDHEEASVEQSTARPDLENAHGVSLGSIYRGHEPMSDAAAIGPRVFRKDAVVGVTDNMCATDAIIYATSGHGVLLISPSLDPVKAIKADIKGEAPTREEEQPRRHELSPGDFAFVPAWTEHQVINEGDVGDVVWVVTRSGGEPVQVDLVGWGDERVGR
ncbi:hypothetical protein VP1G_03181 [Cytospora mali]|uniref:Cupin type-2 domain-containing protein n=1 Tax=Cytospora mali TaxID=578113 RepID=A0A194UVX6_CYTMA|nr:hypothetical protein VP1G_03181 [Valsa mali var. pyri (nom. inval.)]